MIVQGGNTLARYSDNVNVYPDNIALFRLAVANGGPSTTASPTTMTTSTQTSATASPSNGWNFLGCYTDSVSARTLGNTIAVSGGTGATTIEACQAACHALGYSLAGVEYSHECYCDNALRNGGGPAPDGSAQCNMACAGNSAETCGGPNRLDLYQYGSSTPPTGGPKKWNLLGCYTDSVSARTLSTAQTIPNGPGTLTVEICQSLCQNAGYSLAGVEYSVECCTCSFWSFHPLALCIFLNSPLPFPSPPFTSHNLSSFSTIAKPYPQD